MWTVIVSLLSINNCTFPSFLDKATCYNSGFVGDGEEKSKKKTRLNQRNHLGNDTDGILSSVNQCAGWRGVGVGAWLSWIALWLAPETKEGSVSIPPPAILKPCTEYNSVHLSYRILAPRSSLSESLKSIWWTEFLSLWFFCRAEIVN